MKPTKQSWLLAGGLLSAFAASLCCLGPLLALILGTGSFAASSRFAQWRPYLLVGSFGLLALAWYLTYRRPQAACAEGNPCAPGAGGKLSKIFLWIVTAIAIPAAILPSLVSSGNAPVPTSGVAGGTELRVRIPSMDCAACAKGIEATLRRTPGVLRAVVDYGTKRAVIVFEPRITTAAQIVANIDGTGFKAEFSGQASSAVPSSASKKTDACCTPESTETSVVGQTAEGGEK